MANGAFENSEGKMSYNTKVTVIRVHGGSDTYERVKYVEISHASRVCHIIVIKDGMRYVYTYPLEQIIRIEEIGVEL